MGGGRMFMGGMGGFGGGGGGAPTPLYGNTALSESSADVVARPADQTHTEILGPSDGDINAGVPGPAVLDLLGRDAILSTLCSRFAIDDVGRRNYEPH